MKKRITMVLLFLCCVLLMGAVQAPVLPTNGFYVNDYRSVLFDQHRDDMFELSTKVYEQTGVQVVLLTVDSLGNMEDMDSYADGVIHGWPIGGEDGANGVLFLVCTGLTEAKVYVGSALPGLYGYRDTPINVNATNVSKAIMNVYRPMVADIYTQAGITPDEATLKLMENPTGENNGPFSVPSVIFLLAAILVVGRSFRVSRKYRLKHLKNSVRKPKTYARTYDKEEQYEDEEMYKILHDDMD